MSITVKLLLTKKKQKNITLPTLHCFVMKSLLNCVTQQSHFHFLLSVIFISSLLEFNPCQLSICVNINRCSVVKLTPSYCPFSRKLSVHLSNDEREIRKQISEMESKSHPINLTTSINKLKMDWKYLS